MRKFIEKGRPVKKPIKKIDPHFSISKQIFLIISFAVAILCFAPKSQADTLILHPSANHTALTTGTWTFTGVGATAANALDDNDGNNRYVTNSTSGNKLYMDMDTTSFAGYTISAVQVIAVARCTTCNTGITLGLRVGAADIDRLGSASTVSSVSYKTFSGTSYPTNPVTSTAWTWTDINSIIPIISHSSANALLVTELYLKVTYTKVIYPTDKDPLTSAFTGNGTLSSSGTTVTGSGTTFTTQLQVGTIITAAGQTRTVTAIASATSMTVSSAFSPVLPAGTAYTYVGWAYTPIGSEATAMTSNDTTTYAQSITQDDKLYLGFATYPLSSAQITGVQLNVMARCVTMPCNLEVGIRAGGVDFMTSYDNVLGAGQVYSSSGGTSLRGTGTNFNGDLEVGSVITVSGQTRTVTAIADDNNLTVSSAWSPALPTSSSGALPWYFQGAKTAYGQYTSDFYQQNPASQAFWTWNDINSLLGVVNHVTNSNGLRVTQAWLTINFISPVVLSFTHDTGYGSTKGVNPDSGGPTTTYTYKIVYTDLNNQAPDSITVYIGDGINFDGGHAMLPDTSAEDPTFEDGNYVNGEQYVYTTPSALATGPHNYYFSATKATDTAQTAVLPGPGVSIQSGTKIILPSGEYSSSSAWSFVGQSADTALDTNDGNTSYALDSPSAAQDIGDVLYLTMDGSNITGPTITSVQVSAILCGSANSAAIGLRLNGTDYMSQDISPLSACNTYTQYTPTSANFSVNPDTGKPWTWTEIDDMIGVLQNTDFPASSGGGFRGGSPNPPPPGFQATQFQVAVTYTPIALSFPPDEIGYITDGVNPDSGKNTTNFTYKVVYTNTNGTALGTACVPAAPKIYIDGGAGQCMLKDTSPADPTLNDGNFIDGEQYFLTKTLANGAHTYYFDATDAATPTPNTARLPSAAATSFSGPAVSIPAGSFTLLPSDMVDGSNGWTFCPSGSRRRSDCNDPSTALDTNDGDSSYARSRDANEYLYMSMDDPVYNGQYITSVQVQAYASHESLSADFTLGVYNVAVLNESPTLTTTGTTYSLFKGTEYGVNPMSGLPWAWTDLTNLIAVVHHIDSDDMRVTQLFVVVKYGPLVLQNSQESNYIVRGVSPTNGNTGTTYTYKIIYNQVNDTPPAGSCVPAAPKVYIDGDAGHCMVKDNSSSAALHNNTYSDGEQYLYTTNALTQGSHRYYFDASDGTVTARTPLASPGTGTISSSGTAVTGSGTKFTKELKVGNTIITASQNRVVTVISSDTSLTTASAFSPVITAGTAYTYAQDYTGPDVALNAGVTPNLHPSGTATNVTTTGWQFCNSSGSCSTGGGSGYTPDVALDSNDGNTSYARSTGVGHRLYMAMDNPTPSTVTQISNVQLTALVEHASSTTGFDLGIRIGPADFLSGITKTTTGAYSAYTVSFPFNPVTQEAWKWDDIPSLNALIVHLTNNNEIRVTELYMTVNYSPILLSYPTDPQYFDDGVDPNGGTASTQFKYRIVYQQMFGLAPGGSCVPTGPKVYIDGDTGHCMIKETQAPANLQDNIYTDGEEYVYTTTLPAQGLPHNYYFDVVDTNGNTLRIPALSGTTLSGPVVSAKAPTLSFANQTGYAFRSAGTGTLTSPGTCPFPNNVTGTGTLFTTQLQIGNTITASDGQTVTVTAISSDTCMTTDTPFTPNLSGATFTYAAWSGNGTLSNASGSPTVTGVATNFLSRLQIGSTISAGGQTRAVIAISSDTNITTDSAFSPNLSGSSYTFYSDPGLRGVEPNMGTVTQPFTYKIIYTDGDNNPPQVGPRLLLDYNTTVYQMNQDVGVTTTGIGTISSTSTTVTGTGTSFLTELVVGDTITASAQTKTITAIASNTSLTVNSAFSSNLPGGTSFTHNGLSDGNYTNGEQYTVTVTISNPGTHAYSFDVFDGVSTTIWPLNGDGFLSPSVTDSVASSVLIYPSGRNIQTTQFTFQGIDQDPSTALGQGYIGNGTIFTTLNGAGTISNTAGSTTVTGTGTTFTTQLQVGSTIVANGQTRTVTAIASATSLTVNSAFSPILSGATFIYSGTAVTGTASNFTVMNPLTSLVTAAGQTQVVNTVTDDTHLATIAGFNPPIFSTTPANWFYDGDYSYAKSTRSNAKLYMNMTQVGPSTSIITSVQLFAYVRDTGNQVNFSVGFQFGGTNYASNYTTGGNSTYVKYAGPSYGATKPGGGLWTWDDINTLLGYVSNNCGCSSYYNSREIRVTQMFVKVGTSNLPILSYSPEGGYYGTEGIEPDGGSPAQPFTYKVVFASGANLAPTSIQVFIDGVPHNMIHDGAYITNDPLRNGDYTDGEQFYYSTLANQLSAGPHTYYFQATDGVNPAFKLPSGAGTSLPGPNVSNHDPVLSLSTATGYITDGVEPNSGQSAVTQFAYKVIYTDGDNNGPLYVKVHIDGDAGRIMARDTGATKTGAGTISSSSTTVTGTGTSFLTELVVGDTLTASAQTKTITAITNNTSLTVNSAFSSNLSSGTIFTHNGPSDGNYINGEQYIYTASLSLGSHTYFFEATDGAKQVFLPIVPSLGSLSGPTVFDSSRPSAINNLAISSRQTDGTTLTWTAPGNDSTSGGCPCGTVVSYNIRYSTLQIIDDGSTPAVGQINFSNATLVLNPPTPKSFGSTETLTVTNLSSNSAYYFAIKSLDEVPLISLLSNVVNSGNNPPVPTTTLFTGLNMVSVPMTPSPATVDIVFGASVGNPVNVMKWVSTGPTNATGSWISLLQTDIVQPGVGYFLESPDETRFLNPTGTAVATGSTSLSLTQGWNLIGNPYNKDVNLENTCIVRNGASTATACTLALNQADYKSFPNAMAAGWPVGNSLYYWNGVTYAFEAFDGIGTPKAALRMWKAYWLVLNTSNSTYQLIIVKP